MKRSAGLLIFTRKEQSPKVVLVHPGGPFWQHKDSWTIPKGEHEAGEQALATAYREFQEEVGMAPPPGKPIELGEITDGQKINQIWAIEGVVDLALFTCNSCTMEWPPHSGKTIEFPENDRAAWFSLSEAKQKLFKGQQGFIDRLASHLGVEIAPTPKPAHLQQKLL